MIQSHIAKNPYETTVLSLSPSLPLFLSPYRHVGSAANLHGLSNGVN